MEGWMAGWKILNYPIIQPSKACYQRCGKKGREDKGLQLCWNSKGYHMSHAREIRHLEAGFSGFRPGERIFLYEHYEIAYSASEKMAHVNNFILAWKRLMTCSSTAQ